MRVRGPRDSGARDAGARDSGTGKPGARDMGAGDFGTRKRTAVGRDAESPLRARADRIVAARDRKRAPLGESPGHGMVRLHLDVGREFGVRPQDLVGAITNEAGVTGRAVGAIEIADHHSIVEIAEEVAAEVLTALRGTLIKGKKATVRKV